MEIMNTEKYLLLADGMSSHTLKWTRELLKYYDLHLVSFRGIRDEIAVEFGTNDLSKRLIAMNMNIRTGGGNALVLRAIPKIACFCRELKPAVIHAHYLTSYGVVASMVRRLSCPDALLAVSAWGSDVLVTPRKNGFYRLLTQTVLNSADIVTADSDYLSSCIREIGRIKQLLTFPFGVEEIPDCDEVTKDAALLFSNRALEPNYNISLLLEWFAAASARKPQLRLVIANDGSETSRLKDLVMKWKIADRVDFVGYLRADEQAAFYRKAQFFVSIPSSDSTSVSLLEAMSYGCIPIVSNIPANLEWVMPNKNGMMFSLNLSVESLFKVSAFTLNRDIIRQRALWKDNVQRFVAALKTRTRMNDEGTVNGQR